MQAGKTEIKIEAEKHLFINIKTYQFQHERAPLLYQNETKTSLELLNTTHTSNIVYACVHMVHITVILVGLINNQYNLSEQFAKQQNPITYKIESIFNNA